MARRALKPPAEKLTAGRPIKVPPANAAEILQEAAASGASLKGMAITCGVGVDVLRRWIDEDPALSEAIEKGREAERKVLHGVVYKVATEGTGKDALLAAFYLLNTRHGYRETEPEQGNRVNITFNLPGAMPLDQFMTIDDDKRNDNAERLPE